MVLQQQSETFSENEIDKKAEEEDPKAKLLKELLEDPVRYVNAIPLIVTASGVFAGVFLVPWLTRISYRYIEHLPALILISAVCVVVFASLGILNLPQDRNLPCRKNMPTVM